MFIHDIIKMEYVRQGYLPNYPYHLISDKEMFDAFLYYPELDWGDLGQTYVIGSTEQANVQYAFFSDKSKGDDLISCMTEGPGYIRLYNDNYLAVSWGDNYKDSILSINGVSMLTGVNGCIFAGQTEAQVQTSIVLNNDSINTVTVTTKDRKQCVTFLLRVRYTESITDCYFADNYPCIDKSLQPEYEVLIHEIKYHIDRYLQSKQTSTVIPIPDWVYSYMVGTTISVNSSQADRHDMLVLLNMDNIDDEITSDIMKACLYESKRWLLKWKPEDKEHRPPTMFGEPHVIKSLRIQQADINK